MGKLSIIYRKLSELKLYASNARTHSRKQTNQIAAAIEEFGFTNPVLVDKDGQIIAGHGRVKAAKQLGLTEIPTIEIGHLTRAQKRALRLADNRLAWELRPDGVYHLCEPREGEPVRNYHETLMQEASGPERTAAAPAGEQSFQIA